MLPLDLIIYLITFLLEKNNSTCYVCTGVLAKNISFERKSFSAKRVNEFLNTSLGHAYGAQ
jgi:hypothetical protein